MSPGRAVLLGPVLNFSQGDPAETQNGAKLGSGFTVPRKRAIASAGGKLT